jgi:protein-disulfide isomerase
LRISTLVALLASAALLSDYAAGAPSFCSASSGCGAVRASQYSQVKLADGQFLPLPLFGVAGFALLYAASMLSRRLVFVAAGLGGAVALWLLIVQAFVLKRFCWLCVTTDVAALVAAGAAFGVARQKSPDTSRVLPAWSWWSLGLLALAAPLLWPFVKVAPSVPGPVLAHYVPSKLNVVEFADYQCPACRRFHEILKPVLARHGDRVHFVRLNKPLDSHHYARDAARAAICGEAQGKREAMADALFEAQDLSPTGIDAVAAGLGLDAKQFEACMLASETNARVDREAAMLSGDEFEGLPTTYIGGQRLLGVRSAAELENALERAGRGEGVSGVAWYVYLPAVLLLTLLLVRVGLRRRSL